MYIPYGPFGLRGKDGEQSRVEQIQYKICLFLAYTTLLPFTPPPSPIHPNRPYTTTLYIYIYIENTGIKNVSSLAKLCQLLFQILELGLGRVGRIGIVILHHPLVFLLEHKGERMGGATYMNGAHKFLTIYKYLTF